MKRKVKKNMEMNDYMPNTFNFNYWKKEETDKGEEIVGSQPRSVQEQGLGYSEDSSLLKIINDRGNLGGDTFDCDISNPEPVASPKPVPKPVPVAPKPLPEPLPESSDLDKEILILSSLKDMVSKEIEGLKQKKLEEKKPKIIVRDSGELWFLTDVLLWARRQVRLSTDERSRIIHERYVKLLEKAKQCHNDLNRTLPPPVSVPQFPQQQLSQQPFFPGPGYKRSVGDVLSFYLRYQNIINGLGILLILFFAWRLFS